VSLGVFAFIDCFPLAALLEQRARPWLRGRSVGVVDALTGRLVSASPEAGRRRSPRGTQPVSDPATPLGASGDPAMTVVEQSPSLCDWGRRTVIQAVGPMATWLGERPAGVLAALPRAWAPEPWAASARQELRRLLGFDLPLGIGPSRLVCRIVASQAASSLTVVEAGHEAAFLGPLPLDTLPSLKGEWGRVLRAMGLSTVDEVRRVPLDALTAGLGRVGERVYAEARGIDPPGADAGRFNLWVSRRFPRPATSLRRVERELRGLAEKGTLAMADAGVRPSLARLVLWRADRAREETARPIGLDAPVEAYVMRAVGQILARMGRSRVGVEALAVGFGEPVPCEQTRLALGTTPAALRVVDLLRSVRQRFGEASLQRAFALEHAATP
jgi:DNA polymerase-4